MRDHSSPILVDVCILRLPHDNDEWFQLCLESLKNEPVNIHILDGVEGHIGSGRLRCLTTGNAPYVAYVDPDDMVCRGAFSACVQLLQAAPDKVMAYTREAHITSSGLLIAEYDKSLYEPFFGCREEALRAHHLSVYRRSALPKDLSFLNECPRAPEFVLKDRLWSNNFLFVDRVGYQWRRYPNSASTKIKDASDIERRLLSRRNKLWKFIV